MLVLLSHQFAEASIAEAFATPGTAGGRVAPSAGILNQFHHAISIASGSDIVQGEISIPGM
jgi:hypothetical protein